MFAYNGYYVENIVRKVTLNEDLYGIEILNMYLIILHDTNIYSLFAICCEGERERCLYNKIHTVLLNF